MYVYGATLPEIQSNLCVFISIYLVTLRPYVVFLDSFLTVGLIFFSYPVWLTGLCILSLSLWAK